MVGVGGKGYSVRVNDGVVAWLGCDFDRLCKIKKIRSSNEYLIHFRSEDSLHRFCGLN